MALGGSPIREKFVSPISFEEWNQRFEAHVEQCTDNVLKPIKEQRWSPDFARMVLEKAISKLPLSNLCSCEKCNT